MAPFARREYVGGAPATTLAGTIIDTTLSIVGTDFTGYPTGSVGKFYIVIDEGLSNEEKILCNSRTGNTITVASTGERGEDGTTASGHTAGATINHCFVALDADEANEHYSNAALDHHTNYHTTVRHATKANHAFGDGLTTAFGTPSAPPAIAAAASAGTGDDPAREDHTHAIGAGVVDAAAIAAGAVGSSELADNAVIPGKLHSTIVSDGIALGFGVLVASVDDVTLTRTGGDTHQLAVKTSGIAAGNIASDAVTTAKILDANVTTAKIADSNVTTAKIAADNVTSAKMAPSDTVPHTDTVSLNPSATDNINSTTYVDFPKASAGGPLTLTFTKRRADTKLVIRFMGSRVYLVNASSLSMLAININGSTTPIAQMQIGINLETDKVGGLEVTGLAAGSYPITLKGKVANTGTGLEVSTTSNLFLEVTETF